jgi:phosphatidate cytidylyltransferase
MAAMRYTPTPTRQGGRAGRNLRAAIGVGVALGGLILLCLLVYRPVFAVLVAAAVALGTRELVRAAGVVEARPPLVPLMLGGLAMQALAWFSGTQGLSVAFLLTVAACRVWRLAEGRAGYLRDAATGIFVATYVPLLAGYAVLMAHLDDGAKRIITFVALVVCNDVAGYAVGVMLGRHPMAPTVSPKKSWEGFAGSVLACGGAGVGLFRLLFPAAPLWYGATFGLALALTATFGDLCESMVKRDLGIKDMGNLLPGHGGIMDRLDSLLPGAAVSYVLLNVLL